MCECYSKLPKSLHLLAADTSLAEEKKKKKKQLDVKHTQDGIDHSHKPAGQGRGEQRNGKWKRDKKAHNEE
jgi:hypothetical protein